MPKLSEPGAGHSGGATSLLDRQIAQAEEGINKQRETVDRLAADGHEVRDARKQLILKLDKLASLMRRRASGS